MAEPKMENRTENRKETRTRRAFIVTAGVIVGGALASLPRWCPPGQPTPMVEQRMDAGAKKDTRPWCPCPPKPDAAVPKPDTMPAPDTLAQKPDAKVQPPPPPVKRCNVNGEVEKVPGKIVEQCDPKAEPTGCKTGQECTNKCICKKVGTQDDAKTCSEKGASTIGDEEGASKYAGATTKVSDAVLDAKPTLGGASKVRSTLLACPDKSVRAIGATPRAALEWINKRLKGYKLKKAPDQPEMFKVTTQVE